MNDRCLVCDAENTPLKRGLCGADYERYRRAKSKVKPEELEEWEAALIAKGMLAPDGRRTTDPFLDTLDEIRNRRRD